MHISRRHFSHEFNSFLIEAQKKWLERTIHSLNSMCQELKLPLDPARPAKMVELIIESWDELSTLFKAVRPVKPIFGPKDFLNALQALQHPNKNGHDDPLFKSSLSNLPLPTKDLSALRQKYASLNLTCMQNGVDDQSSVGNFCNALRELHSLKVLQHRSSQHARVFLQNGCPLGFRSRIWALCLNINVTRSDRAYYSQLKQNVAETDLVVDQLIHKEMQLIVGNDEMYFVFCDYIYKVLLPFLRDPKVMEVFASYPGTVLKASRRKNIDSVIYPPSGVIPFHGFSMYVSPLCYLYDDPVQLYIVFRQMYMNYFHRLHIISDDPEGILSLCILFERILQDKEPELVMHLTCVGAPPYVLYALFKTFDTA
uniref:TBC1 domain family member 19 n=1 Tax=Schistocephalus solidus TaxID=70667 RepID=A0A0V0J5L0_SCHSO